MSIFTHLKTIKLIRSDSKDSYNNIAKYFYFRFTLLNFLFIKESWNVFNIDSKMKCLLSIKSEQNDV